MGWADAAFLLEPFPASVVCSFLRERKAASPERWERIQAECDKYRFEEGHTGNVLHGKFFAVDLCTGAVYLSPFPSSGIPVPAVDADKRPITLGWDLDCVK